MRLWGGVCDEDISVPGNGARPGIVVWGVGERVFGPEWEQGGDLRCTVDSQRAGLGTCKSGGGRRDGG